MYAMAATHWARTIHVLFLNRDNALGLQSETADCLIDNTGGEACKLTFDRVFQLVGPEIDLCSEAVELLVMVRSKVRSI